MAVVQNLYKIFKLPASFLVANDCNIKNYTLTKGIKEDNVVSIGDNLVFQQLRYLHGDTRDHKSLFSYITKLRNNIHIYKEHGQYKEAHVLEQRVSEVLFVKDIINVVVDEKKSDFHHFRTKGFYVNNIHYVYLCSGSGQIRRNTATFINEEYRDQIVKTLNCGLDEKTSEFVLAKYSAYFALAFSSILWVRTPRVCVIKDFFHTLKQEPVDFISHDANGKSVINEQLMDLELNCADGQGLIDPEFAKLWSQDMNLSYTPCSFVARSCFIKGNLATFDFKEYAHAHNISIIRDKWGKEYNIDDIDVLLSESQFKTHKYYNSWQEYCNYANTGNIHWGVARYNKRNDDEYVLTNYQYIQSLSLTTDDIQNLIKPTINWIEEVCSGDILSTMLYSFGNKSSGVQFNSLYACAQTPYTKALVKNIDFLDDCYVQQKIYKNITETIDHAKIGKVWIRGNYQFMVSDPVAQCQAALGLPTTGLLKKDEIWSKFWVDRGAEQVDLCRSPMIDVHEHNPSTLHHSDDADHWYQYLSSGIIFSTYDTGTFRAEDADFDGDIVLSTDNEYFIKGAHKDHNIITYEKGLAIPEKMTVANITKTVMKGFGTGVGGFSNTATILYAMAAIFDKPGHEDQYNEIMLRIKLLREIVGQEIDRIKGADKPSLPKEWRTIEKILSTDSQDDVIRKMRSNAMVVKKKPYFFRYLYPELNQKFKLFEASYNQVSRDMFGIKFKKLMKKDDKTEEEKDLVRKYQKYSPLITSPCTMNKLCRAIEDIDFDIKFLKDKNGNKKPLVSKLPTFEDKYSDSFNQATYDIVQKMYQTYSTRKQLKHLDSLKDIIELNGQFDDYSTFHGAAYDDTIKQLQDQLIENNITGEQFLFYCNRLSSHYARFNWGFAWNILDDQIIKLIPNGQSYCPIRDDDGEYEYLGLKYSLKDLTYDTDEEIQDIIDTIFELEGDELPDEQLLAETIKLVQQHENREGDLTGEENYEEY